MRCFVPGYNRDLALRYFVGHLATTTPPVTLRVVIIFVVTVLEVQPQKSGLKKRTKKPPLCGPGPPGSASSIVYLFMAHAALEEYYYCFITIELTGLESSNSDSLELDSVERCQSSTRDQR